jgi:hypothetical protein
MQVFKTDEAIHDEGLLVYNIYNNIVEKIECLVLCLG